MKCRYAPCDYELLDDGDFIFAKMMEAHESGHEKERERIEGDFKGYFDNGGDCFTLYRQDCELLIQDYFKERSLKATSEGTVKGCDCRRKQESVSRAQPRSKACRPTTAACGERRRAGRGKRATTEELSRLTAKELRSCIKKVR